jgi:hypothetical protein
MFEEETKTVEKIVEKLANEAKLEKVPKIEISKEWQPSSNCSKKQEYVQEKHGIPHGLR